MLKNNFSQKIINISSDTSLRERFIEVNTDDRNRANFIKCHVIQFIDRRLENTTGYMGIE